MAEVIPDFTQMDGVQVLLYLIQNDPVFWGFILIGGGVALISYVYDITFNKDDLPPH